MCLPVEAGSDFLCLPHTTPISAVTNEYTPAPLLAVLPDNVQSEASSTETSLAASLSYTPSTTATNETKTPRPTMSEFATLMVVSSTGTDEASTLTASPASTATDATETPTQSTPEDTTLTANPASIDTEVQVQTTSDDTIVKLHSTPTGTVEAETTSEVSSLNLIPVTSFTVKTGASSMKKSSTCKYTKGHGSTTNDPLSNTADGVSYAYIGCYKDQRDRLLPHCFVVDAKAMTTETCMRHCHGNSYAYFGTEVGIECWCGNGVAGRQKARRCNRRCSGNRGTFCGGPWRLSLYRIN